MDAFINLHILIATQDKWESEAFTRLKAVRGMEAMIEAWVETCCEKRTFRHLAGRKEWCHFQELRNERNALQHAVEPFSVCDLRKVERFLNFTQTGVGSLLRLLREWHDKPSVLFIERLRTAPAVQFHHLRFKADTIRVTIDEPGDRQADGTGVDRIKNLAEMAEIRVQTSEKPGKM